VRWLVLLLACVAMPAAHAAIARTQQVVTFASIERDAAGRNVALRGYLLLPRTPPPPGGYPAVIALHG